MIKRRSPLRRMSDRRRDELDERAEVVDAAWKRDGGNCRARLLVGGPCSGQLDPHEIIPRSAWKAGYLVLDNVIMVCRTHHRWIDNHPDEAHARGLHGYSWERLRPQGD